MKKLMLDLMKLYCCVYPCMTMTISSPMTIGNQLSSYSANFTPWRQKWFIDINLMFSAFYRWQLIYQLSYFILKRFRTHSRCTFTEVLQLSLVRGVFAQAKCFQEFVEVYETILVDIQSSCKVLNVLLGHTLCVLA